MSFETDFTAAIAAQCARVYPDFAPPDTARPYVTWQQVGGPVINPMDSSVPGSRGHRVQVNVWADDRKGANELLNAIEDALRPAPLHGRPDGALIARVDELGLLRGAQQDFMFWR